MDPGLAGLNTNEEIGGWWFQLVEAMGLDDLDDDFGMDDDLDEDLDDDFGLDDDLDDLDDDFEEGEDEDELEAMTEQYMARYSGSASMFPAGSSAPFPPPRMAGREVY